jgi:hypothetical protein
VPALVTSVPALITKECTLITNVPRLFTKVRPLFPNVCVLFTNVPALFPKKWCFFFRFLIKKAGKSQGLFVMLKKRVRLLNFTGMETTAPHSGFTKTAGYYHSFFKIEGFLLHRFFSPFSYKTGLFQYKNIQQKS